MLNEKSLQIRTVWQPRQMAVPVAAPALSFDEVERTVRSLAFAPLAGATLDLLSMSLASDGAEVGLDCAVHSPSADFEAVAAALEELNPTSLGARGDAAVHVRVSVC